MRIHAVRSRYLMLAYRINWFYRIYQRIDKALISPRECACWPESPLFANNIMAFSWIWYRFALRRICLLTVLIRTQMVFYYCAKFLRWKYLLTELKLAMYLQSTLVISNSKGLAEILRDISKYFSEALGIRDISNIYLDISNLQNWGKNNSINHI